MKYNQSYDLGSEKYRGLDWVLIKRLTRYLLPYRTFLILAVIFLIFSKGIEAYIPITIGNVAQKILTSFSLDESEKNLLLQNIVIRCLSIIFLLFISYFLESVNVIFKNWVGQNGLFQLRMDVYEKIQKLPIGTFNRTPVGTLMTRTIHDVDQINQMFSESVVPLIGSLFLFVGICIGLIVLDSRAALLLFAILPFVFWLTNFFRKNQRRCYDLIRGIVSALNAFVQEHLMGASTIRSFGLQQEEIKQFKKINQDHRSANIETIHYFALFFSGIDFIQSVSLISIFVLLVTFSGSFEAGTYFTFSLYILMLFRPLADLAERYNLLQSAIAAADRIFQVLDEKTEEDRGDSRLTIDEIESIEFKEVWFAYRDENWVLKGVSFTLNKGESVALVGITGAGKTTIMNLLLRFFDPQKGQICINGVDIRNYPLKVLREQFSVVLQDPEIFSGTIKNNISLGKRSVTGERIETVIQYLDLKSLIIGYDEGIDHYLSERGKSLSAGERQLVSMARAVAHNRSVLILDEATANIDTGTEKKIQEVLKKILHNKTSLIIAHRLSTIKDVDTIIVLHDGVVQERGSHQELLKRKGIYEKLYRLQFR